MLNLNYNIIGAGGYDRYSKEEAKGFIPFQIQYIVVAGGGGSAGGDNNLEAGQAGGGAQVVTGSYCVNPFNTYAVRIGNGGAGGQRTATFPAYTGSNGETSSFDNIIALGGNGGYIQNVVTKSFFAGSGSGAQPIAGNGGEGSQWTYNLPGCFPPFLGCHGGDYLTSSFYGGGGAGFMVDPPLIEYIVVGGGGGAGGSYIAGGSGAGGNGGWGGYVKTGSFTAFPNEVYTMYIGSGGLGAPGPNASGSIGSGSFISGSNTINPHYYYATPGSGGFQSFSFVNPQGGGSFTTQSQQPSRNGANGYLWIDGFVYGGGGGASTEPPNGKGGLGNGADGGFPYDSIGVGGCGPWTEDTNFAGGGAGGIEPQYTPPYRSQQLTKGGDGVVRLRYLGSPIANGGIITTSGSYTYHTFTSSVDFQITLDPLLIYPGLPGVGGGGVTGSNATANTGGGAGASFYFNSGSRGGSGFTAIRYEGAPIAEGGQITVTDHYTYHIYTASGEFYAIGNETNPNINPCP